MNKILFFLCVIVILFLSFAFGYHSIEPLALPAMFQTIVNNDLILIQKIQQHNSEIERKIDLLNEKN